MKIITEEKEEKSIFRGKMYEFPHDLIGATCGFYEKRKSLTVNIYLDRILSEIFLTLTASLSMEKV